MHFLSSGYHAHLGDISWRPQQASATVSILFGRRQRKEVVMEAGADEQTGPGVHPSWRAHRRRLAHGAVRRSRWRPLGLPGHRRLLLSKCAALLVQLRITSHGTRHSGCGRARPPAHPLAGTTQCLAAPSDNCARSTNINALPLNVCGGTLIHLTSRCNACRRVTVGWRRPQRYSQRIKYTNFVFVLYFMAIASRRHPLLAVALRRVWQCSIIMQGTHSPCTKSRLVYASVCFLLVT